MQSPASHPAARARGGVRTANLRTALVLLSIALTFFFGVIFAKSLGGWQVGMSVVGFGVFLYLVLAIGRNLRRGR